MTFRIAMCQALKGLDEAIFEMAKSEEVGQLRMAHEAIQEIWGQFDPTGLRLWRMGEEARFMPAR